MTQYFSLVPVEEDCEYWYVECAYANVWKRMLTRLYKRRWSKIMFYCHGHSLKLTNKAIRDRVARALPSENR